MQTEIKEMTTGNMWKDRYLFVMKKPVPIIKYRH